MWKSVDEQQGKDSGMNMRLQLDVPVRYKADICIIGAGPGGIAAAVCAARLGRKVILLEGNSMPGGLSTAARVPLLMGYSDGKRILMKGFGEEVLSLLNTKYAMDCEKLKLVYEKLLNEAGVQVLYTCRFFAVCREAEEIAAACFSSTGGNFAVRAKVFVDGTGDGNLAVAAGCEFEIGDDFRHGTMPVTMCSLWTGFDWDAFCRGKAFSHNDDNMLRLLDGAFKAGELSVPDWHHPGMTKLNALLAGGNIGHIFNVNPLDEKSVSEALMLCRRQLKEYEHFYRKHIAGFSNAVIADSGSMLGIRESRRIIGEYVLNREDYKARRNFPDEIGRYNFPADIHPPNPTPEALKEHKMHFRAEAYHSGESYGIPYRILVPKKRINLLTCGRCVSCDRYVFASLRVIPGCFITGQAAGYAAALCVEEDCLPYLLNPKQLRRVMAEHRALLQ